MTHYDDQREELANQDWPQDESNIERAVQNGEFVEQEPKNND